MIAVNNIKLPVNYRAGEIEEYLKKKLKTDKIHSYKIHKRSLDSRKHNDIHYNLSVYVEIFSGEGMTSSHILEKERQIVHKLNNKNIMLTKETPYEFPHIINTDVKDFLEVDPSMKPVIIGAGPCGYHAAIKLARAGFKPIVLERGDSVEDRAKCVQSFLEHGLVDDNSNVCFGEGGAGTFSDGKLNTGNKDKGGYFKEVLETFVKYGAPEEILYNAKPHIGTDKLVSIMKNMREAITRLGGDVRFRNRLIDISINHDDKDFPLYLLTVDGNGEIYNISTHSCILAIGHSSRDTYKMLRDKTFAMEKKSFAVGVRAEHPAELINQAMYGADYKERYGDTLPTADYKLVAHTKNGRSVYSFCMCPGGYVINSSTESGRLCINGMSYSERNGANSNSALVVNVEPEDFGSDDLFAGVEFQRSIEKAAYDIAGGAIPVQRYLDFKAAVNIISSDDNDDKSTSENNLEVDVIAPDFEPCIKGKWEYADVCSVLPDFVSESIVMAMPEFARKIRGFDRDDVLFSAVEARTSAPLRVLRDEQLMAPAYPGIFPAGEGCGYAGGITSAAADGIRVAEAVSNYLIEPLIEEYKEYEIDKYSRRN